VAQTPESKVKAKVVAQLKALGAYYFYPVTGGYGGSGVHDIVGCLRGKFFAIECKAGNNKPTPLQQKNIDAITKQGGLVWVVNEENLNEVTNILEAIP
jgi:Holliday junction resolvase